MQPPHAPLPRREVVFWSSPRGLAHGCHDVMIFPFIEVGLLEVASYSDDSVRTRHLELWVGVVGDDHELGVAWSAQDGVIGVGEIRYFEGERFRAEIGSSSEHHG